MVNHTQGTAAAGNGNSARGERKSFSQNGGAAGEEKKTNRAFFALYLGFFAGIIWGAVKIIEYIFKFTRVIPAFLAEPFYRHDFLLTWQGTLVGWLFFIVFSIQASFIYMFLFGKVRGPWMGVGYGIAWWCLLYLVIGPWTGMMGSMYFSDWNTILTDFCLFLVWGLFIGYSTAFEFTEEHSRKPA
ncbi:YqhR family membrane protein [Paenibacillus chitinolyticus]|uniref:YqhR family membrane protein n=1 Tax=Paenibacillus chitinolyticus TaxID=79263 RepID=UPI0035E29F21